MTSPTREGAPAIQTDAQEGDEQSARARQEVSDALAARDDYLAMVAHDLKNPLTTVKLKIDTLLRARGRGAEGFNPETVASKLEAMQKQIDRMVRLINHLMEVVRLEQPHLLLTSETIDLGQLAADAQARCAEELGLAGCTLSVHTEGHVEARGDLLLLEQVLGHVLDNAIKYGPGTPIEIRVCQRGDRALLSVRDEGPGIAPEDQTRIFERFERASRDRPLGTFGLGLWMTRRILAAMDGSISLSSEVGHGATFTIDLPGVVPDR